METTIIRLSRPLLLRADDNFYQTVYGFGYKGCLDNENLKAIDDYVGYLAGLNVYANGGNMFTVSNNKDELPYWIDKQGDTHMKKDEWMKGIFKKCRKKLNLSYDIIRLEMDEDFLNSCLNEYELIVDETLYYDLERYMGKKDKHQGLQEYAPL